MNVTVGIAMDVIRDYPDLDIATQMEIAVYRDRGVSSPGLEHTMIETAAARKAMMANKGQHFIIARMTGHHPVPSFSQRPFVHADCAAAQIEQQRLAVRHNAAFGLYQLLHIYCAPDGE